MKTTASDVLETKENIFWCKAIFESDNEAQKCTIFMGATRHFFNYEEKGKYKNDEKNWFIKEIEHWKSFGDTIFDKKVHLDIHGADEAEKKNVKTFLEGVWRKTKY